MARVGSIALAILAAAAFALIVVGPRVLPYRLVPVEGASMEPTIHLGSVAGMRPIRASDVRVGDIIIFGRTDVAGELVTHRVVKIVHTPTGPAFLTKGDANGAPDAWFVPAVGTGWRYSFSVPLLGWVFVGMRSATARAVASGLLIMVCASWILVGIWRPAATPAAT